MDGAQKPRRKQTPEDRQKPVHTIAVVEVRDALGQRTTSVYFAAGRLSATMNPLGQRTSYLCI